MNKRGGLAGPFTVGRRQALRVLPLRYNPHNPNRPTPNRSRSNRAAQRAIAVSTENTSGADRFVSCDVGSRQVGILPDRLSTITCSFGKRRICDEKYDVLVGCIHAVACCRGLERLACRGARFGKQAGGGSWNRFLGACGDGTVGSATDAADHRPGRGQRPAGDRPSRTHLPLGILRREEQRAMFQAPRLLWRSLRLDHPSRTLTRRGGSQSE